MKALRNQPLTLYSPTASLLRLSSTKSFSYGLRPLHTLQLCVKVPIIERRDITGAAGIMRVAVRAVAREVASLQQQNDVRKRCRYLYNIFYFQLAQK
jgi:hypothetical protein